MVILGNGFKTIPLQKQGDDIMLTQQFTYHYLCQSKGIPMTAATKDIYDLITRPDKLLIIFFLIFYRGLPPVLAIDKDLSQIYAKYNLTSSYMNPIVGRMISHILCLFSLDATSSKGVKAMTNGLMSSAATYSDVTPGSPSTFDRNNNPISWHPQPVVSFDLRNMQVVPAKFVNQKYIRII